MTTMITTQAVHIAAYLLLKNHRPTVRRLSPQQFSFEFPDEALADLTDYQNGAVVSARLLADAHATIKCLMRTASAPTTPTGAAGQAGAR
jgi:hypothetical protein